MDLVRSFFSVGASLGLLARFLVILPPGMEEERAGPSSKTSLAAYIGDFRSTEVLRLTESLEIPCAAWLRRAVNAAMLTGVIVELLRRLIRLAELAVLKVAEEEYVLEYELRDGRLDGVMFNDERLGREI